MRRGQHPGRRRRQFLRPIPARILEFAIQRDRAPRRVRVFPVSDALTITAVCTTAPEVGSPIIDAGIEKLCSVAHALASSFSGVSFAARPGAARPIASTNGSAAREYVQPVCFMFPPRSEGIGYSIAPGTATA